jgi:CheY-like chemotaxis protein/tetratricopeptide (TPR) repeat protein
LEDFLAGFRNQILIFEDDPTQLEALKMAFGREGFVVHSAIDPNHANEILSSNAIGTLIIDCLLPDISGVEFVESIRTKYPAHTLDVILMSGIFTDPTFVRESLQATGAKHFLKKPFPLKDVLSLVEKPATESTNSVVSLNPRMNLYQLFSQGKMTPRNRRKALEALDEIYGFDLPFVYSLLVESKMSGHLNLVASNSDVFGITISDGFIVKVDIPDKESYLGKLLVEAGYLHPDDLATAVADKSNRKLGEKLAASFMVSPHAIDLALTQQLSIRLSKTIVDQKISMNFVDTKIDMVHPNYAPEAFVTFLHDWIASKISLQWLRAHYVQWLDCPMVKTPSFKIDHPALQSPLVKALPGLVEFLISGAPLSQIIDSQKYADEPFYKATHYLLTRGLIVFVTEISQLSNVDRLKKLSRLYRQLENLSKIETFDLMSQMVVGGNNTPEYVIRNFTKLIGPQPATEDSELHSVHQRLSNMANHAFEFAKSGKREKMRDEIARSELEVKLNASQQFEEAKNQLQKNAYAMAMDLLTKAKAADPNIDKLRIYLAWAKIGLVTNADRARTIKEVEMELMQVPPEEKFDAIFAFVQGLVAKANNDIHGAAKLFHKAIALDSSLIPARRELNILSSTANQRKDVFNRDLKDVFGSIFKRK